MVCRERAEAADPRRYRSLPLARSRVMSCKNVLLSENSAPDSGLGVREELRHAVLYLSSLLLYFFCFFFPPAGLTHFFKGLGIKDFLKSFHEFRAFQPI